MTLPYEQFIAMNNARNFMYSLFSPFNPNYIRKGIPKAVREAARRITKHFPSEMEADQIIANHMEVMDRQCMNPDEKDPVVRYSPRHMGWVWTDINGNVSRPYTTKRDAERCYWTMHQKSPQEAISTIPDRSGWQEGEGTEGKPEARQSRPEPRTMKADGFEDCVLGVGSRIDNNVPIIVYDLDKCASVLVERDGMTLDEAYEYLHTNTIGAWVGEGTPLFIRKVDSIQEAEELLDNS